MTQPEGEADLGAVMPPEFNAAEYLFAARLIETWRVEENLARILKERAAQLQLSGVLRHVQLAAWEEATGAKLKADILRIQILTRMGRD